MQKTFTQNTKETFVAMFTHDLKGPINSGIMALELLLNESKFGKLNQFQKQLLTDVLSASRFMKNLTENALCKYKEENGKFAINKEICPFKKLVEDCIFEMKYLIQDKNQIINFVSPKDEIFANVDMLEMRRAICNLISNASKYSSKDSRINVFLKLENNKIYFEVQDFGCGINLKHLDSVFDKYVRLANEQKSAGTGLGLYIARLIVDAHGGKIDIKSIIGKGTKIFFEIPV